MRVVIAELILHKSAQKMNDCNGDSKSKSVLTRTKLFPSSSDRPC